MDMTKVGDDFRVCLCRERSKKEIMDFIKENNIHDIMTLRSEMNVGNKCGGCGEDLESLIKMVWEN